MHDDGGEVNEEGGVEVKQDDQDEEKMVELGDDLVVDAKDMKEGDDNGDGVGMHDDGVKVNVVDANGMKEGDDRGYGAGMHDDDEGGVEVKEDDQDRNMVGWVMILWWKTRA